MISKTTKSIIWTTAIAMGLLTFIPAKYFGTGFSAVITHKLAIIVSTFVHLAKSLNLGQYRPDAGNILLVAFLALLIFWRALLLRKAQV